MPCKPSYVVCVERSTLCITTYSFSRRAVHFHIKACRKSSTCCLGGILLCTPLSLSTDQADARGVCADFHMRTGSTCMSLWSSSPVTSWTSSSGARSGTMWQSMCPALPRRWALRLPSTQLPRSAHIRSPQQTCPAVVSSCCITHISVLRLPMLVKEGFAIAMRLTVSLLPLLVAIDRYHLLANSCAAIAFVQHGSICVSMQQICSQRGHLWHCCCLLLYKIYSAKCN